MSGTDLAARLEVTAPAVTKLEHSERLGRIRLDTLERAANALGCDLVYALVPRKSLEDLVRERAEEVVASDYASVTNTMRLEAQGLTGEDARDAYDALVTSVATERDLWRLDGRS